MKCLCLFIFSAAVGLKEIKYTPSIDDTGFKKRQRSTPKTNLKELSFFLCFQHLFSTKILLITIPLDYDRLNSSVYCIAHCIVCISVSDILSHELAVVHMLNRGVSVGKIKNCLARVSRLSIVRKHA